MAPMDVCRPALESAGTSGIHPANDQRSQYDSCRAKTLNDIDTLEDLRQSTFKYLSLNSVFFMQRSWFTYRNFLTVLGLLFAVWFIWNFYLLIGYFFIAGWSHFWADQ